MATEQPLYDRSYIAETDLSLKQFRLVEMSGSDQVDVCDGAGDLAIGILQNDPAAGQAATVRHLGVSKCVVDGTANGGISVMSRIGTDGNGKGVRKTANNDVFIGYALDAATADGVIIRVLMLGPGQVGA